LSKQRVFLVLGDNPDEVLAKAMEITSAHHAAHDPALRRELTSSFRCFDQVFKAFEDNLWLPQEECQEIVAEMMRVESLRTLKKFAKQLPCRLARMKWDREHASSTISATNGHINGTRIEGPTAECEKSAESLEDLEQRASQVKDAKALKEYRKGLAAKKPRDRRRAFCNAVRLEELASAAPPTDNPKRRWKKSTQQV
jgi:hypothetical protein